MNVPTIGQGPGSVTAFTGPRASTPVAPPRPDADVNFTWVGWFDLHDTGHIVNRSPASGGDGVMIVPSVVHVPTYTRTVQRAQATESHAPAARPDTAKDAGETKAPPPTEAQTRQAIDAYQRYGQDTAPDTSQPERAVA
jgi:hypothetical protein